MGEQAPTSGESKPRKSNLAGIIIGSAIGCVVWISISTAMEWTGVLLNLALGGIGAVLVAPSLRAKVWEIMRRTPPPSTPWRIAVPVVLFAISGGGFAAWGLTAQPATTEPAPSDVDRKPAGGERKHSTAKNPQGTSPKKMAGPVSISAEAQDAETGAPRIVGTTNLPAGTKLLISLETERPYQLQGQADAQVSRGSFSAGPFRTSNPLPDGSYVASIVMPVPSTQSAEVRGVIGERGENLKGDLVKQDPDLGPTVELRVPFIVGKDAESARRAEQQRVKDTGKEAHAILRELRALEKKGRGMDPVRKTKDPARLRKCGELMRERQAQAKALQQRAEALPKAVGVELVAAAIGLAGCVSCLPDAASNCKIARSYISDAEKAVKAWRP